MSSCDEHKCSKRGCKTKKPEVLVCSPGYGFPKDGIDTSWLCETCYESVNGEKIREFQKRERGSKSEANE